MSDNRETIRQALIGEVLDYMKWMEFSHSFVLDALAVKYTPVHVPDRGYSAIFVELSDGTTIEFMVNRFPTGDVLGPFPADVVARVQS